MPQCRGKIAYESQLAANAALLQMWKKFEQGQTNRREIKTYRCVVCDKFHTTSNPDIRRMA